MNGYRVVWEIDVSAGSPREAAEKAREIMMDPDSSATVFSVTKHDTGNTETIDLEYTEENVCAGCITEDCYERGKATQCTGRVVA